MVGVTVHRAIEKLHLSRDRCRLRDFFLASDEAGCYRIKPRMNPGLSPELSPEFKKRK